MNDQGGSPVGESKTRQSRMADALCMGGVIPLVCCPPGRFCLCSQHVWWFASGVSRIILRAQRGCYLAPRNQFHTLAGCQRVPSSTGWPLRTASTLSCQAHALCGCVTVVPPQNGRQSMVSRTRLVFRA